jgi:hypothetical protein
MLFVRRTLAVLSSLFLLQLTLLGSDTLCATGRGAIAVGGAGHSMRGMAGMASGHHDCGLPWAPTQCTAMTTCGVAAAPAAPMLASSAAPTTPVQIAAAEAGRSGPSFAPELPPPRA